MDDPVNEIRGIVLSLTTGNRFLQQDTLGAYFTPTASFKHPFCAVAGSRDAILRIFQWYKILSPKIEIEVNSVAFDEANLVLYLNISQLFCIRFIPYYRAPVTLTTILHLEPSRGHHPLGAEKYFICSQEDLYQTDEWIKFLLPFEIGVTIVRFWHWIATLFCVAGAKFFGHVSSHLASVKQSIRQAKVEGVEEGKPMLVGEEVVEVEEERRDSKGVKEGAEGAKEAAEGLGKENGSPSRIPKVVERNDGTVRVKGKANGKKSVREMEKDRKANVLESK